MAKQSYDKEIEHISKSTQIEYLEAKTLLTKALITGEVDGIKNLEYWLENRLKPNLVFLDEGDYSKMALSALRVVPKLSAGDYNKARQRDLGQIWGDVTRGYLGELAVKKLLSQRYKTEVTLGHQEGNVKEYLPTDIHEILDSSGTIRKCNSKVGIKTTKLNGIWLDIPANQFRIPHAHILVKLGIGRDHLFGFFNRLNVFHDKIFARALQDKILDENEVKRLTDQIPTFRNIPAYVSGIVLPQLFPRNDFSYNGKKGRKNYKINSGAGRISAENLNNIKTKMKIKNRGKLSFEGIEIFSHEGFIFSSDRLLYKNEDWINLITSM